MIGGLLTESGGAAKIVDTITNNVSEHRLPWAMAGLAALIGLPLFFEVGVVLLVPSCCWCRAGRRHRCCG